ncbi:Pyridoxal-5'-phosphate-dependent enzyme, beta subunit [Plesiocystis pacifica SIR-1]|uniref:Pyridoxal-5'-phosphate-dependent enzyme, beta subunit n=1 Tax=Plesiocystis pacifica SIR-1 TaxID=391625 RepID=A6G3T5_9BACT|nr:threonine/serine dehydratase [Plesiocystis pacifica]EDM79472.1 Pyridoxal-5'-phosphate-dependent enzyme, beta subunit [Plesiocystis pacifica SIR-1]
MLGALAPSAPAQPEVEIEDPALAGLRPSFAEILGARRRLSGLLPPTPLVRHPGLSARVGVDCLVKLENTQPVGAFKVRGGLNLLLTSSPEQRARGYVTATRGNHGQSLAYACARFGSRCALVVPRGNDPAKNRAMRELGAELLVTGVDFDAAWEAARGLAEQRGATLVHPGATQALVAGVGTWALELLEQSPGPLDAVFVPVGVGSCVAGTAIALRARSPHTQVIGVQSAAAPAMTLAWRGRSDAGHPPAPTLADGLAVGRVVAETMAVMRALVDDMVLVDEDALARAIRWYAETLGQLAEGAGAAALAGAHQLASRFRGGRVAVLLSGGNVDPRRLLTVLTGEDRERG